MVRFKVVEDKVINRLEGGSGGFELCLELGDGTGPVLCKVNKGGFFSTDEVGVQGYAVGMGQIPSKRVADFTSA